jgi:hypothetical protein
MKRHFYHFIIILVLGFLSCKKNDIPGKYDPSKITVTVLDTSANAAFVGLSSKDVKGLGIFTIGVCYSINAEPTVLNEHVELNVNSDTLTEADLDMFYFLTNLTKAEDYYLRGYIKINADIYYSAEKTFKTKNNTLIVDVSYNYVPSGKEYWMVLSNKSTTLLTQKLENGGTYTFSNNIPDLADFHLFKWDAINNKLYVESYVDIVPDEFYLDNPYTSTNLGQINVTVSDISNFLGWGVASSWWWNTTTSSITKTLSTAISKNPDNLFINYIPSDGSAPMFKSVDNVTPFASYTYTMSDFTALTNFVNVTLPENVFFNYTLAGFNTDYYTEFKKYHGYSYTAGYSGTFKLYYPTEINTNYYLYTFYNTANQQSFYNKIGSLPTTYFSTFPAITINNSSQYTTTTSAIDNYSTYEVMDFCGIYSNAGLNIQWDYYKQPQSSNSVQIPEFPAEVKLKINNLTTNDLSFSDVGYFDILNSEVGSYKSYVDLLIKQSERFYDVVKERRYYFQWVNKKSFDSTTKSLNMQEFQN